MTRSSLRSSRALVSLLPLLVLLGVSAACLSVQDFGGEAPAPGDDGGADEGEAPDAGLLGDESPAAVGTWKWHWINPAPTGRSLYGIGGTSETDIWVAGEGGTVAHWNGTSWDVRHTGPDGARYFAVGAQKKNDVWVAGDVNGRIDVVHYDGKDWIESYPFAGSTFGGFGHGPGSRLFAFVDWDILELASDGTWQRTDTSANPVFGPPADLWVAASGEAWAITSGAKILHLPAGSQKWELQGPIAGVPSNAAGLSIAGAGSKLCAFYTSRNASSGTGYLTYDGAWHVAPTSTDPLTLDNAAHGARSACFADGSGLLAYDGNIVLASATTAPNMHMATDFPNEKLFGAWSAGGAKAYLIGALGGFVTRGPGAIDGAEAGSTVRHDLLAVDVGLDGAVFAADAREPDRSSGGEVLTFGGGALRAYAGSPGGFLPPQIPVGVAVVAETDAWVLANDGSGVGVAHYRDGAWGVTRILASPGDPLAIWAPAKDDVWVTGREHCPDPGASPTTPCSKTLSPLAWHYDGSAWSEVAAPAILRSIHGSAPNDVWFAGDAVAHWDGKTLSRVPALTGSYAGVWASAPGRVWLWGDRAVLFDGKTTTRVEKALGASTEWTTTGIAEARTGDVFVLTKQATGTALLWFDPSHSKLVEQVSSDLELGSIRGRGDELWAIGAGGAALRFAPPTVN